MYILSYIFHLAKLRSAIIVVIILYVRDDDNGKLYLTGEYKSIEDVFSEIYDPVYDRFMLNILPDEVLTDNITK